MAIKTNGPISISFILILTLAHVKSFLDLEELRSTNYGIDILNEPVKMGEERPDSVVQLRSKFGQPYQCSFPDQVEQDKQKEEEEKLALETGIVQLLKPFQSQGCIFKTRDWWSYEFCYGKYIRQMHVEDGTIKGEIIYLGRFESEFDWENSTLKDQRLKGGRFKRYHSQTYTNGSKCDLTQTGRRSEVRFFCEVGATDYINRIDEPETCVYVVSIHTARICNHPYLKPPSPKKPVPITCNPVLTTDQYDKYLLEVQELEAKKERQRLLEEVWRKPVPVADVADSTGDADMPDLDSVFAPSVENLMKKRLADEMKQLARKSTDLPVDVKLSLKVVKTAKEMEDFLKQGSSENKEENTEHVTGSEEDAGKSREFGNVKDEVKDSGIGVEGNDGIAPEEDSATASGKDAGKLLFESVKDEKKEDDNIATGDGDVVVVDDDDDLAEMEEFDREIKELQAAYRNKREKFASMKNKVRTAVQGQFDNIIEEAEEMFGEEIDKTLAFKQLASTLDKLVKKLESTEKEIENADQVLEKYNKQSQELSPSGPKEGELSKDGAGAKGDVANDRLSVRVTTAKFSNPEDEVEVPDAQREQLEKTVKEGLIKAGLDAEGGKIQVKIITTGYYDNDDDSVHLLSPEDTSQFQNMIVAILGGTNEASKEAEKQQQLEDNYGYVWGQDKNKKSKPIKHINY